MGKNWTVEEGLRGEGVIWIEDSATGETVCDLYFKKDYAKHALMTEYHVFSNAKEHAELIASAPQQQALIEELLTMMKGILDCDKGEHALQYCSDCYTEAQMLIIKAERKE